MADEPDDTGAEELSEEELEADTETEGDDTEADGEEPDADDAEDEGAEGDEGEGEDPEPEPEAKRGKPSRGANLRHRAQESERLAREASEKADRLEREIAALRGTGTEADRARQEAEEQLRLATMTPDEKIAFYRDKDRREFSGALGAIRRENQAAADLSKFDAMVARNPRYERFRDEVEKRFDNAMKTGGFITRDNILRWVLGDAAMKGSPKAAEKQRRVAAAKRQRETAKPGSGRSDVAVARGKKGKSAADRLADVTF